jgi:streptogrisin C
MPRKTLSGLVVGVCAVTLSAASAGVAAPQPPTGSAVTPRFESFQGVRSAGQAVAPGPAAASPTPTAANAPNSIRYLVSRYSISEKEAQRRLALQAESAQLAAELAAKYPGEYAGMWLDQAGGGVLRVAMTNPSLVPARPGVVVVPAQRSLASLEEEARQVAAAHPDAQVYVDQRSNQVMVQELPGFVLKCDPLHCHESPLRGGIRLDIPRDNGTVGGCTTGFLLWSTVLRRTYVLTAGHCVVSSTHTHRDDTWHEFLGAHTPVTIEDLDTRLAENDFTIGRDYAVMPFQDGAQALWFGGTPRRTGPEPQIVLYKGSTKAITGFVPVSSVQTGWIVCASGAGYTPGPTDPPYVDSGAGVGYVPGTHCGEVTSVGGRIAVRICARKGDSGGPLYTEADGKALGILSGGDERSGPCVPGDTETNLYAPFSTILDRVNSRTANAYGFVLAPGGPAPVTPRR